MTPSMDNEYPVDVVTSFADYMAFLQRQVPISQVPPGGDHLAVVERVFDKAQQNQTRRPDLAFVCYMRVLHIGYEKAQLRSDRAVTLFKQSVAHAETLKKDVLPRLLSVLNSRVEASLSERAKTVEQQKLVPSNNETENNVSPAVVDEEDPAVAHERRRQALLNGSPNKLPQDLPSQKIEYDDEAAYRLKQQRVLEQENLRMQALQAKLSGGTPTNNIVPPSSAVTIPLVKRNQEAAVPLYSPPNASHHQPPPPPTNLPTSNTTTTATTPPSIAAQPATTVVPQPQTRPEPLPTPIIKEPPATVVAPPAIRQVTTSTVIRPWSYSPKPWSQNRRGLVNLGNTCYLNSITQCLAQTLFGRNFLDDAFFSDLFDTTDRLVASFAFVVRELYAQSPSAVSTSGFKFQCGKLNESFAGKSQQDANEFLRTVLDGMHESLNKHKRNAFTPVDIQNILGADDEIAKQYWAQYKARNSSIVEKFFVYQERSCIECPTCHQRARAFSPAMGVELSIPSSAPQQRQQPCTIHDCLQQYCQPEILDRDSLYNCANCKKKVAASKTLSFHSAPEILIITLKRFRAYGDFSDKINTSILFGEELDIAPYVTGNQSRTKYRLSGAVYHQGNMHGGHYTCDVQGAVDQSWCRFSDENLQLPASPDFKLVYILFYARQ